MKWKISWFVFVLIACSRSALPQSLGTIHVSSSIEGSAPPIRTIYTCKNKLEGETYSQIKIDRCLKGILETGYFLQGHVTAKPDSAGSVNVNFSLQAPKLTLKSLDFVLPEHLRSKFQETLEGNLRTLRVGDTYDSHAEAATVSALEFFLTDNGYRAAISSRLDLDYSDATAKLTYRIFLVPSQSHNFMRPPSQLDCDDVIDELNLTDIDDYVPLPLLEQFMSIHPTGCFSTDAIAQDKNRLEKTGLFTHVNYVVSGEAGSRNVSLQVQGKKLQVKDIDFEKFGNEIDIRSLDKGRLSLHIGAPFRQSLMRSSAGQIGTDLGKTGQLAWVVSAVTLSQDNQVSVRFQIVGFTADEVYVNGTKVPSDEISLTTQFTE